MTVRQGGVQAGIDPTAFFREVGKQPQLLAGPPPFAAQPWQRQVAFTGRGGQQRIAQLFKVVGDPTQQCGPPWRRLKGRRQCGDGMDFGLKCF